MSKKCSVRSLSECALGELGHLIVSTIGYVKYAPNLGLDINVVMVEINQYLEAGGATSNIYQDLLRVILSSDYLEADMRLTCLQMLLNCGVSFLVIEMFPFNYHEKILLVIAAQGSGLRVLNLKGIWVKDEYMHLMVDIIKKCTNLTKLFVPYLATDELLEAVAKYCRRLQVLDISGETDVTEIGLDMLSNGICNAVLTVVDIGMPGEENICYSDVALILENCPNVQTLSTYSFVGAALKHICDNVDQDFKCKLKYLHDTRTDEDHMGVIVGTCPQLESLYLESPKPGILHLLRNTFLRKLKIYQFSVAELIQVLENIGHTMSHLTMIKGAGNVDIGHLARICPCLVDLDCYMIESLSYSNYESRFQCLQGLEMLSSRMTKASLKAFICSCIQLKRLALDSVSFDDQELISIFNEHNFIELEDLWFTLAPNLTIKSVQIIMDRCPELQSIGKLSGWSLNPDDLALLRGILKSGNSSLVLTPNGVFP